MRTRHPAFILLLLVLVCCVLNAGFATRRATASVTSECMEIEEGADESLKELPEEVLTHKANVRACTFNVAALDSGCTTALLHPEADRNLQLLCSLGWRLPLRI